VEMGDRTALVDSVTSREPGLLFVDISAMGVITRVHETDLGVLGQIDASFGW